MKVMLSIVIASALALAAAVCPPKARAALSPYANSNFSYSTKSLGPGPAESEPAPAAQKKPFGKLFVVCEPGDAAVKLVDNDKPFSQGIALDPGQYVIEVARSGFETMVINLDVFSGQATTVQVELAALEPGTQEDLLKSLVSGQPALGQGRLFVETVPPGAKVRIMNIKPKFQQGISLEEGLYTIDAQLPGYEKQVEFIEVVGGKDARLKIVLSRQTPPAIAEKGPAEAKPERPVQAQARITNSDLSAARTLKAEFPQPFKVRLQQRLPARLYVRTNPPGAAVRILNIWPAFEQGIKLSSGRYVLDASLPGHETIKRFVDLDHGEVKTILLDLAPAQAGPNLAETGGEPLPAQDSPKKDAQARQAAPEDSALQAQTGPDKAEEPAALAQNPAKAKTEKVGPKSSDGRLFVRTVPDGARIRILNIKPKFEQGMALPADTYFVDASLDGYKTKVAKVVMTRRSDFTLEMNLARLDDGLAKPGPALAEKPAAPRDPSPAAEKKAEPVKQAVKEPEPVKQAAKQAEPVKQTVEQAEPAKQAAKEKTPEAPQPLATEADKTPAKPAIASTGSGEVRELVAKAEAALDQGDFKAAVAASQKAISIDPAYAEAYKTNGDACLDQQQYQQAIVYYDKAIALEPNDSRFHYNKALAYDYLQQSKAALAAYTMAIRINPVDPDAYNNRGNIYNLLKLPTKAMADYSQAIKLDPNYAYAYDNRGLVYMSMGDCHRSCQDFQTACELGLCDNYNNALRTRRCPCKVLGGIETPTPNKQ